MKASSTVLHLIFAVLVAAMPIFAAGEGDAPVPERPTFFKDVLPILQSNCQSCHRPVAENIGGMLAPMALVTYDEVRPWARSIALKARSRDMPPWFASEHTRGQFQGERILSDAEIETLVRWSSTGALRGVPEDAPPAPVFALDEDQGWTNGMPDLVVSLPQPYWVEDDLEDLNINFSVTLSEEQLPESAWVQGVEFKVGGTYVHHMCASANPPGTTDALSVGKFTRFALGCIALGAEPTLLPDGYGLYLEKGSTIRFSMHYHKEPGEGTGSWDQSQLGFVFAKEPVKHRVRYEPIGNLSFEVPPGKERWLVGAARTFEEETELIALWPHAHLRAVAARYLATYPDGSEELLLDVPRYDQEWQTTYRYLEPRTLPAGTRLEVLFWYDNSPERAVERGFNAERAVRFGPATTDEMMLGFLNFTHAEPIDFAAHPERIADAALGSETE